MTKKRSTKKVAPRMDPEDRRDRRVCLRLTDRQANRLARKAKKAGLSVSTYIARCLEG